MLGLEFVRYVVFSLSSAWAENPSWAIFNSERPTEFPSSGFCYVEIYLANMNKFVLVVICRIVCDSYLYPEESF